MLYFFIFCQCFILSVVRAYGEEETVNGDLCTFPFAYGNVIYFACIPINGKLSCSLDPILVTDSKRWGECYNYIEKTDDGEVCDIPFSHDGIMYKTCFEMSSFIMCALDRVTLKQGECSKKNRPVVTKSYHVTKVSHNYKKAVQYCKEKQMELINFDDAKLNNAIGIIKLLQISSFWVGVTFGRDFANGVSIEKDYYVSYSNYKNENNVAEVCVHIGFDMNLADNEVLNYKKCSEDIDVVCSKA